ncbi:MAG: polysaccharide deacetylase family protein [Clostridia bacterium]|nr:polysaccharide deacetylase family protein [Clostridia bacterium]
MKKLIISIILAAAMVIPCGAAGSYNWYCCHKKDHTQPSADAPIAFIEKYGGYYCDTAHSDWNDKEKVIYLTFDAGYENGNIEKILDTLKEKDVKGTFFILENMTKQNADLVQRMASEGHFVCNHTAMHYNMSKVTDKGEFMAELKRLEDDCAAIGVECKKYYRPPEGCFSEDNLKWACEEGYKTLFWSFAYADWDNNAQMAPDAAMKKILDGTHNGEIILLHPTSATNAQILGDLIDAWRKEGFRFALPDELK